jgi:thiol:disulfide interchange protein DsbD
VLGGLIGGLILNLMPCVFPVLAIKLLALAQPGTARPRAVPPAWPMVRAWC